MAVHAFRPPARAVVFLAAAFLVGVAGAAFPVGFCSGPEAGRCANGPSPATTYIATAALPWRVTVRETLTGAQRTITIGNGGRIVAQQ